MPTSLCYMGNGCMGCSFCEHLHMPSPEEVKKQREDKLRSEGKPTLTVSLGDILKKRYCNAPKNS